MTITERPASILSESIIDRCGQRAPGYDRENRFFTEDFQELRDAGYLLLAVPREFGGHGLSLAEVCHEQRRLADRAPATALATNMHLFWTGIAADLYRAGDRSLTWLLEEAAQGEVFAAGHGEAGNDLPVLLSTANAERVDGLDPFIASLFAWALLNFGNVYYAIATRARDLAVLAVHKKSSLAVSRSMAYHPEAQHQAAQMTLEIDAVGPHLDRVAQEWSEGIDHGARRPSNIVSAKYHAVDSAKRVVDLAMDMSGGAMFKTNELERLYRDVRCGGFHPANSALVHETVGKTALGIDLGEQPRWG